MCSTPVQLLGPTSSGPLWRYGICHQSRTGSRVAFPAVITFVKCLATMNKSRSEWRCQRTVRIPPRHALSPLWEPVFSQMNPHWRQTGRQGNSCARIFRTIKILITPVPHRGTRFVIKLFMLHTDNVEADRRGSPSTLKPLVQSSVSL